MVAIRVLAFVTIALAQVAHAQDVQRSRRGDTSVVITKGSGKWGPPHDAVEVLRVPGDTKETSFGAAFQLQGTADGGVVVFDTKAEEGLIIRQFDKDGKFVRNLGRQGPGPGEYMRSNASIAAHPNGSIYVRDDDKSVSIFGPDGKLANTFALAFNNGSTTEIYAAADGSLYLRAPFSRTTGFSASDLRPMLHYTADGKLLDSISVSSRWLSDGSPASQIWRVLPDGRVIVTRTDKIGFLIPGATPLIAEVPAVPVPYLPAEREELRVARNLYLDKCGGAGRGGRPAERVIIPEMKQLSRGAAIDIDGRVWIGRSTTSERIPPKLIGSCFSQGRGSFKAEGTYEEPPVFVAFQTDGTYLGEVRFPLRARVTFAGKFAWALVPDADDVQTLVKYRLY